MDSTLWQSLGSVYTPPEFATFLTNWAIRDRQDKALDVGVGDGVFVFSAYRRLRRLGASASSAQNQIFGAEVHPPTYRTFVQNALRDGLAFPHVYDEDFFRAEFPNVNAVIGNPPYVRRAHMKDVDFIRGQVLKGQDLMQPQDLSRLTDLYVYFLLHALSRLTDGGRCAVITADPWLTVGYGRILKKYLRRNFHVDYLITLDRRVFDQADVKPVLLLATKTSQELHPRPSKATYFVRVKNGLAISVLERSLTKRDFSLPDVSHVVIDQAQLTPERSWSIYFKAPEIGEKLRNHPLMTPLSNLGQTRIGIQTLAKDFFVLTSEHAQQARIENEFLAPLAQSLRFTNQPIIEPEDQSNFYLFYCSRSMQELEGTHAFDYIRAGENRKVAVRGKDGLNVLGYHQKERIKRAGRKYWYDLKTGLERRGRARILIPRLMYKSYMVLWNKAYFVPGELFIEFLPSPLFALEDEVYLAVLSSSITEIMLRVSAQVYGGGTYNLNPGQAKQVPIVNVHLLTDGQREQLKAAYYEYTMDPDHDRAPIDEVVFRALGFSSVETHMLHQTLNDLLLIAASTKQSRFSHMRVVHS